MKKGTLILLCGLPGSGKTTLAKQLEVERQAIRLCADEWIIAILADKSDASEIDRLRKPVEELLWQMAQKIIESGTNVILENGFWSRSERDLYRDRIKALDLAVELHYLSVPIETLLERLEYRNKNLDGSSFEIDLEKLIVWNHEFETPTKDEEGDYNFFRKYDRR